MSNNQATAERYEPKRFLCDMSDCVDGGDSCKAQMKTSIAGAFVYHSDYAQLLAEIGRLREALEIIAAKEYDVWAFSEARSIARAALTGKGAGE